MIQLPTSDATLGQPPPPTHAPCSAPEEGSKETAPELVDEEGASSNLPQAEPQQQDLLGKEGQRQPMIEHDHSEPMDTSRGNMAVGGEKGAQEEKGGLAGVGEEEREMIEGGSRGVQECGRSNAVNKQREKRGETDSQQMAVTGVGVGEVVQQDRHCLIYHHSCLAESPKEDLPDEFYRVTIDDVLIMQRDLKAKAASFDAPLETRAMRQSSDGAVQTAEKYNKVCCVQASRSQRLLYELARKIPPGGRFYLLCTAANVSLCVSPSCCQVLAMVSVCTGYMRRVLCTSCGPWALICTTIGDSPTVGHQLNCPCSFRPLFVCSFPTVGSFKECLSPVRTVSVGEGGEDRQSGCGTSAACSLLGLVQSCSLIGHTGVA